MHDDGARASSPSLEPPYGVPGRARWLRLTLVLQAVRSVALWVGGSTLLAVAPFSLLMTMTSLLLIMAVAALWARWCNACREHLIGLGGKPSFGPLGLPWILSQLIPIVGWTMQLRVLHGLVAATDPRKLAPVTEERTQEGGFRQSAVVRVEVGSVARPLLPLWALVTGLTMAIPLLGWRGLRSPTLTTTRALGSWLGALLAVHLVSAVTHNLGELEHRLRRRV